jgi:hypothetical protein
MSRHQDRRGIDAGSRRQFHRNELDLHDAVDVAL